MIPIIFFHPSKNASMGCGKRLNHTIRNRNVLQVIIRCLPPLFKPLFKATKCLSPELYYFHPKPRNSKHAEAPPTLFPHIAAATAPIVAEGASDAPHIDRLDSTHEPQEEEEAEEEEDEYLKKCMCLQFGNFSFS